MHGNPEHEKNSIFKATGAPVGYYDFPRSIRDSDGDGDAGPIDCIKAKGISIKQEWLGDVVHLKDTVTQTFEIFFASSIQPPAQDSLEAWINHLNDADVPGSGKFIDVGAWHDELNLYGIKIPNCRITSIDAPTSENRNNDAVGRGQINVTVEQKRCGDFENLDSYERTIDVDGTPTTINDYLGLKELFQGSNASSEEDDVCPYLEDLTEDFKFNYGKGNQVEIEHSVGIKLFDSCPKGILRDLNGDPYAPGTPGQLVPGTDVDGDNVDDNFCRHPDQYNVDKALILARKILDKNVPKFGIAFHGGILNEIDTDDIITYYTESQNLLTGDVSMSKKITLYKHQYCCPDWEMYGFSSEQSCIDENTLPGIIERCGWSADYNHTVVMDTRGIVTVTEKGKVKGMKKIPSAAADAKKVSDAAYDKALAGLEQLIGSDWANSAARCVLAYDEHKDYFMHADPATLAVGGELREFGGANQPTMPTLNTNHPIDRTKSFNNVGRDCSYSITFTTDPNYYQDYSASRTLSAKKDRTGAIGVTEKVTLKQHEPKGSGGNPIETIYPMDFAGHGVIPGSKARVDAFYGDLSSDFQAPAYGCFEQPPNATVPKPLKLMSRNISFDPNGRSLSYTTNYATDKTISCHYPDEHGVRKLDISIDDKIPRRMKQEYPIVNWKILVHDSFQTGLGERVVTMRAELDREPKVNKLTDPKLPKKSLDRLAELAKDKLLEVFADNDLDGLVADDMYLKSCTYTFDSAGKATLKVAANYLQAMEI